MVSREKKGLQDKENGTSDEEYSLQHENQCKSLTMDYKMKKWTKLKQKQFNCDLETLP